MLFINWLYKTCKDDKPIYLGGSVAGGLTGCIRIIGGISSSCRALTCDHEDVDERILFHINYAIQVEICRKIIVAATDTDTFTIYNIVVSLSAMDI